MKAMRSWFLAVLFVLCSMVPAFAQTSFVDGVTLDTAPVLVLAGIVLTALGGIWAIRKAVKLVNRS